MAVSINVKHDLDRFARSLDVLGREQLPFAAALALTATARGAAAAVTREIERVFDRPTPFTKRAVAVEPARKGNLRARVFLRDIQAGYLAPSILARRQVATKRAVLNPKAVKRNAYGNIPRRELARLKNDPRVFVGRIKTTKGTELAGVFRRVTKKGAGGKGKGPVPAGRLQLLIAFGRGVELKPIFDFAGIVTASVSETFAGNLGDAMTRALASAR